MDHRRKISRCPQKLIRHLPLPKMVSKAPKRSKSYKIEQPTLKETEEMMEMTAVTIATLRMTIAIVISK